MTFGTRPEAIKLCPVILYLISHPKNFDVRVCATAQHREMLDSVLATFGVRCDYDLNIMRAGQTLTQTAARTLADFEPVLASEQPDMVLVQGDTTTTFCGALAAWYAGIPVGHIEAGLRTGNLDRPFPEEMNRVLTGRLATLHFAATPLAAANLLSEGVDSGCVHVTGNTGIDAVLHVRDRLDAQTMAGRSWPQLIEGNKIVVVTAHRRESFGEGLKRICAALSRIAALPNVQVIYPVHPNPNVRDAVENELRNVPNIVLTEPLDYPGFIDLLRRSDIILTDSGGVQEEAPSLGKPVLVLREDTERQEAVKAGTARLVGTDEEAIFRETSLLLQDPMEYKRRSIIHNPYGDGHASERIGAALIRHFSSMRT